MTDPAPNPNSQTDAETEEQRTSSFVFDFIAWTGLSAALIGAYGFLFIHR